LEEKLGFSNGYIGKMAKRPNSPPYDKLVAIANELGVTVADLTWDFENEKKPTAQGDGLDVDYIEKWIDNDASEEQLKQFIAKASAKLVKK
uniref:helix-turn-helix domain-containing protein n=1 Tax=Gemmiger formicilis TaxID=745368 RepID=UPI003FF04BCA